MKTLLAIGALLVCANANFITGCEDIKGRTDEINKGRINEAIEYQIANMHEITYDPKLEEVMSEFESCDTLDNGVNHRLHRFQDKENNRIWKEFLNISGYKGDQNTDYHEQLHPLQTGYVTCYVDAECKKFRFDPDDKDKKIKFATVYGRIKAFGPVATLSLSDFKHGPPGSQCPNGKADSGLCTAPIPKKVEEQLHDEPDVRMGRRMRKFGSRKMSFVSSLFVFILWNLV